MGGGERFGAPGGLDSARRRSRCSLWTRSRRRADPALPALPWLPGRVSGQRRVTDRLGERCGRGSRARGTRSFGLRRSSGGLGQDLPEGGRGNLRLCCQEPRLVCVGVSARGLGSLPCALAGPGDCGRGAGPGPGLCSRVWGRVAPRSRSPWAAGSFVPAPRCPLFLPSAGRRGREEGGSCCPDVSALNDCGPGQSRAGVCRSWAPCLSAFGVCSGPAARG